MKEFDAYTSPDNMLEFIVDSGCTSHSLANKRAFFNYRPYPESARRVQMADNSEIAIAGKGSISFQTVPDENTDSVKLNLHKANHIPDLSGNYFSVSAAANNGIASVFHENCVYLYTGLEPELLAANLIATGQRRDDLFYLKRKTNT